MPLKVRFFFFLDALEVENQVKKRFLVSFFNFFVRWVPKNRKNRYFHRSRAYFGFQPAKYRISKPPNSRYYAPRPQLHSFLGTDEQQLPWDRFYIILEYRKRRNLVEMMLFQRHNRNFSAS